MTKRKKKRGQLAKFLFSLRIQRGVANISDYLRIYNLPISDAYYRDLESGTKSISIDTADQLCSALRADRRVFFFHLLNDLLPSDIVATLVRPIADDTFASLEERQALLERDKTIYREALAASMLAETNVLSDKALETLLRRPDLMPVLHFLYATQEATVNQLISVLNRNSISDSPQEIAALFVQIDLAIIEGDISSEDWSIRRKMVISRVPLTERGKELKRAFAIREVTKSLDQKPLNRNWSDIGAFVDSSILEFSPDAVASVRARLLDALAEARAGEEPISTGHSIPYFLGIFFGSRTEYSPEIESQDLDDKQ